MKRVLIFGLLSAWVITSCGSDIKSRSEKEESGSISEVEKGYQRIHYYDFEKIELESSSQAGKGDLPDDLFVLDGTFLIDTYEKNKVLKLGGTPLGDFGVLFGKKGREKIAVRAKVLGLASGRRLPTFGVGLNGRSGYLLKVNLGARRIELMSQHQILAQKPYQRKGDEWVWLHLEWAENENERVLRGKVWTEQEPEPKEWSIQVSVDTEPRAGKPSLWGYPFAGKPIYFDEISVFEKENADAGSK